MVLRSTAALLFSLGLLAPSIGQTLDPSFGSAGMFTYTVNDSSETFRDIARMDDGRIVLVGTTYDADGAGALRVVRLLADGTPDASFGNGGAIALEVADGNTEGLAVEVLGSGRILVAGNTEQSATRRMIVRRMLVNGQPDLDFAQGGTYISSVEANDHLRCMLLQPDGRILIGGDVTSDLTTRGCIIRLTATGALDASFGTNGVVEHSTFGGDEELSVNDMALDAAGMILATGFTNFNTNNDVYVMRLLEDGGMDPDFALAGELVITDNAFDEFAAAIALAPGGDMYLVGTRFGVGGDDLVFYHISAEGEALDLGGDIVWQLEQPGSEYATELLLDGQGHLVVSLTAYDANFIAQATVLRVATTPAVDVSFGTAGWLTAPDTESDAGSILFQPDGKLLFCGSHLPLGGTSSGRVARYGDIPASIAEQASAFDAVLAPNPAHGRFTVNADAAIDQVQVLDATGRVVADDRSTTRGSRTIDLPTSVVPGVYTVSLHSGDRRWVQRLVVE